MNQPQHTPCPNCLEFYLRGHLEGQAHARLTDEQSAELAARLQLALELEAEDNRRMAKSAGSFIDVIVSREARALANESRRDSRPGQQVAA